MKNSLTSFVVVASLSLLTLSTGALAVRKMMGENNRKNQIAALRVSVNDENSGCIITISGKKYNATELQKTHSGGDIFSCGTDMTNIFIGQHGKNMNLIGKYLIGNVGIGNGILPTSTITPTSVPTKASKCLVKISGNSYDITNLRSTHSGGDIFKCGTDMTSIFNGKHGSNWNLISKYLISTGNNSNPTSIPPTPVPTTSSNNNQCIVTISGSLYDVTALRTTHSGGDIFKCGTDMTSTFSGKHGNNLSLISRYLIANGSTSGTPMPTVTAALQREDDD